MKNHAEVKFLKPNTLPGKPPKQYNKGKSRDKAIGLFVSTHRGCIEIIRGKIMSLGDIYVFPVPQTQREFPFHEAFHKSGEFHWRIKGEKTFPICGSKDLPAAFKMSFFRIGQAPCFCFRRGKRLKDHEIRALVENLSRYTPPVDVEEVTRALEKQGFYRGFREDIAIIDKVLRKVDTSSFLGKKLISKLKDPEFSIDTNNPLARFLFKTAIKLLR